MSDVNNKFLKVFGSIITGIVIIGIAAMITFAQETNARVTTVETTQRIKNETTQRALDATNLEVDTMKKEWREDMKEIRDDIKDINAKLKN